jgi:hypothetical protein
MAQLTSTLACYFTSLKNDSLGFWLLDYLLIDINTTWIIIILNNANYLSHKLYQLHICDIFLNMYATHVLTFQ